MVKNFGEYQHYKERNPPWIKIHSKILRDYTLAECLQDASKLHLIFIWVLSSQLDNKIPNNSAWVKQQIGATEDVDLDLFIKHGFLVPWVDPLVNKEDTETLAECLQDASTLHTNADSETEAETYKQEAYKQETETEEHGISKTKKQKKEKTYDEDDFAFAQKMATDISSWSDSFKAPSVERWADDIRKFREYEKVTTELMLATWTAIQADSPIHNQRDGSTWTGWRSIVLTPKNFRKNYHNIRVKLNLDNSNVKPTLADGKPIFVSA